MDICAQLTDFHLVSMHMIYLGNQMNGKTREIKNKKYVKYQIPSGKSGPHLDDWYETMP